eukprot:745724-Pelagomonas_calceolata.AAC.1
MNRKAVTYHHWCGKTLKQMASTLSHIPSYLFKDLDKHDMRNVSRLRLRAYCLKVESCKWLGGSRVRKSKTRYMLSPFTFLAGAIHSV